MVCPDREMPTQQVIKKGDNSNIKREITPI
jgi:hypothetical protein